MTGWIVFAAIVLVLVFISLIRLGGIITFNDAGAQVKILAGPFKIQVYPSKTGKKEKPGKNVSRKRRKKPGSTGEQSHEQNSIGRILQIVPTVCEAAGTLKRRIRIDRLNITVIWGAEDAASAAIGYGEANAVAGIFWPLIHNNFRVKDCNFHIDVDYGRNTPKIGADGSFTITIGQLVSFLVHYSIKLIMLWSRSGKRPVKQQEANENE